MTETEPQDFEDLLDYLKATRSFDFKAYKKNTLKRRIERRMHAVGSKTFGDYRQVLETSADEFAQLFDTFLINVTSFFRDPGAWDYVTESVIPLLLKEKHPADPIRVWSAGCATGEEAFTLAMLLAEALGPEAFRSRVKIYATDLDEQALLIARQGIFDAKHVAGVPPELLNRYFEQLNGMYCFRKDLRRSVIFGRHDLLEDAPISRVDILACRNTLMYFNSQGQARILARLHFSLSEQGYLLLGRAETLLAHNTTFRPVELKQRVFAKVNGARFQRPIYLMPDGESGQARLAGGHGPVDDMREIAFNSRSDAQIIVDRTGVLAAANEAARKFFGITGRDTGRMFQDLEISYRPLELRSLIQKAQMEQRPVKITGVEHQQGPDDTQWLDIHVVPLPGRNGEQLGVSLTFTDTTGTRRLQHALERTSLELETAYQQLQSASEEMETTNEELQSTIEELETTNEELQASNEELETMNEELQATNDELQLVNDAARTYATELDTANNLLESISSGLNHRLFVLDRELRVILWSDGSEGLWGVTSQEARGRHINDIDFGLPFALVEEGVKAVLDGQARRFVQSVGAVNRRGRKIDCTVTLAPLFKGKAGRVAGVIIVTDDGNAERPSIVS